MDLYTASSLGMRNIVHKTLKENRKLMLNCNNEGWTPLMYACAYSRKGIVHMCVNAVPESIFSTSRNGLTSLMIAAKSGDLSIVKLVMSPKLLEWRDRRGWTALFYAVHYCNTDIICYLIQSGADINARDYEQRSILSRAMEMGLENPLEILIIAGAVHDLTIDESRLSAEHIQSFRQLHPHLMILINFSTIVNLDNFLSVIGMDSYNKIFSTNHINFNAFLKLDEFHMKKMGIDKLGPRRRLSLAIEKYNHFKDIQIRLNNL